MLNLMRMNPKKEEEMIENLDVIPPIDNNNQEEDSGSDIGSGSDVEEEKAAAKGSKWFVQAATKAKPVEKEIKPEKEKKTKTNQKKR